MMDNESSAKACKVLGTINEQVEMEFRKLVELGVFLKTLMHSFLTAPIVVVSKADISARTCGD